MKRITALILLLTILSLTLIFTVSCKGDVPPDETPETSNPGGDATINGDEGGEKESAAIRVPEYRDYERGSINFSDMVYERPDFDAISSDFNEVIEKIRDTTSSYEEKLNAVYSLEEGYAKLRGMAAIAGIYAKRDAANEKWAEEDLFINTAYPAFIKTVEELYVAAASSPYADKFALDYFGEELYDYKDGGIYTDEIVLLMEKEAELEGEYTALSTATVKISYNNITDTFDNILAFYADKYGEESREYLQALTSCNTLYEEELTRISCELLVSLLKQRRLISDALGYESYEKFAYDTIYHDYEREELEIFLEDVTEYVIPVYVSLSNYVFSPYIYEYNQSNSSFKTDRVTLINTLYDVFSQKDEKLGEIYSYMLQHSLYDIENAVQNRYDGAFSTYIEQYNAPFLFASLTGSPLDYLTVAHEFGHFADAYINYNITASLDVLEISSQAAELLILSSLKGEFSENDYRYILYLELQNIFEVLIFQSFYASFEAAVYELPYDAITLDSVNKTVADTAKSFGLSSAVNSAEYILIPHIILYPFYVQSYSTSAAVAAEIYCAEIKNPGDGFEIYSKLLDRSEGAFEFEEQIKKAGLTSPFEDGALRNIVDRIYFSVVGAHYYNA